MNCCRGTSDFKPIHVACINGHPECLKELIEARADVEAMCLNPRDHSYRRPIHFATEHDNAECVSILVRAGANYNAVKENGLTSFYVAALCNLEECLLAHTRNTVEVVQTRFPDLLRQAVINNMVEGVRALLHMGFDPNVAIHGESCFHDVSDARVLRLLLEGRECDLNTRDFLGHVPLYYAVGIHARIDGCHYGYYGKDPELVKIMLAHGADPTYCFGNSTRTVLENEMKALVPNRAILNALLYCTNKLPRPETLYDAHREVLKRYAEIRSSPRTLLHYSRTAVRKSLSHAVHANSLPLPSELKQYLLFEWSDEVLF